MPIGTVIPIPTESTKEAERDALRQVALQREAGFVVIDMLDVYGSLPGYEGIWIATWDRHPNAQGHRMLADGLYAGLLRELGIGASGSGPTDDIERHPLESKGAKWHRTAD